MIESARTSSWDIVRDPPAGSTVVSEDVISKRKKKMRNELQSTWCATGNVRVRTSTTHVGFVRMMEKKGIGKPKVAFWRFDGRALFKLIVTTV